MRTAQRFDVPFWARPLLAGALAWPVAWLVTTMRLDESPVAPLEIAGWWLAASLFAALNLAAADAGRRRDAVRLAAIAVVTGAVVTAVWSRGIVAKPLRTSAFILGDTLAAKIDLTYVYSAAFGAVLGWRLTRPGPRPRLAVALGVLAGAAAGAWSWYFTIEEPAKRLLRPFNDLVKEPGAFAAMIEIAAWVPLAAAEALVARLRGLGLSEAPPGTTSRSG
jgi:hypothetical protein